MSEQPEQMQTGPSGAQAAVDWVLTNKLRAIGYTWLTGIGGTLAYQWSKPGSTSVKLIHSRIMAQALTLGALGSVALLELYNQEELPPKKDDY